MSVLYITSKNQLKKDKLRPHLESKFPKLWKSISACGETAVELEDDVKGKGVRNGAEGKPHSYQKVLHCSKSLCPVCSEKNSEAHKRRYARMIRKFRHFVENEPMGYAVFTVPPALRPHFKDKVSLGFLMKAAASVVQGVLGVDGAVVSMHFFGDKTLDYHPHVNVIFPLLADRGKRKVYEHLSKKKLDFLRSEWKDALKDYTKEDIDQVSVHYQFSGTEARKVHKFKYVGRSTVPFEAFLNLDDDMQEFLVDGLFRFHNVRYYGEFSNCKWKSFYFHLGAEFPKDLKKLLCPLCFRPLVVKQITGRRINRIRDGDDGDEDCTLPNGLVLTVMPRWDFDDQLKDSIAVKHKELLGQRGDYAFIRGYDEGEVWKENGRLEEHYHEDVLEKPLDRYYKG